jgi:hypothetical protein
MINAQWADGEAKTVIEITWMKSSQKGQGRQEYETWEKSLPPTVKLITLFAADSDGSGNSDQFWEKMGFDWVWSPGDDSDIDYESLHRMHKGVNGHPTPDSKHWEN